MSGDRRSFIPRPDVIVAALALVACAGYYAALRLGLAEWAAASYVAWPLAIYQLVVGPLASVAACYLVGAALGRWARVASESVRRGLIVFAALVVGLYLLVFATVAALPGALAEAGVLEAAVSLMREVLPALLPPAGLVAGLCSRRAA